MAEPIPAAPSLPCKPRWYAPTPAKFLFAVLVMQGVLFLSAHYRWFWFNEQKGYTVLITVAATAVALFLLAGVVVVSRFFKSRAQFSLATLLLMVPIMAIPCAWLAREVEKAQQQRNLVKSARLLVTNPRDVSNYWFVEGLGAEFFRDVKAIHFGRNAITDEHILKLKDLTQLEGFCLHGNQVTDTRLEQLKEVTQLRELYLSGNAITDVQLAHLEGLTQLRSIHILGTRVTAEGVRRLEGALPNCVVYRD